MYINVFLFFFIAFVYSTAGFGGGSLYLALIAQSAMLPEMIKLTALGSNAAVTAIGSYNFNRSGWMRFRKSLPLLVVSVPFCILTSFISLSDAVFFQSLAAGLFLAAMAMLFQMRIQKSEDAPSSRGSKWLLPAASLAGAIAGLTGIGGGVYLSPLLYLSKWDQPKAIAATCSLFILINSIAGLSVKFFAKGIFPGSEEWMLIAAAAIGGMAGSMSGSKIFSQQTVRILTIALLIFASIRLFLR